MDLRYAVATGRTIRPVKPSRNLLAGLVLAVEVILVVMAVVIGGWWIAAAVGVGIALGVVASAGPGGGEVGFTLWDAGARDRDARDARRDRLGR